jgi:hypothetical protein
MQRLFVTAILVLGLGLGGCTGMSSSQQSTLSGGAIGAAAGAGITAVTGGCVACGAAIGGAVGAAGGYLLDQNDSNRSRHRDRY